MKKLTLKLNKDEFKKKLDIKDGETPSDSKLTELIKPLIPEVKDGETPSDSKLTELIKPLIPAPIPGSPDKPEEIVSKLQTVKREWLDIDAIRGDFNTKVTRPANNFFDKRLSSLTTDVLITNPQIGQNLEWNGTNWVNSTDDSGGITGSGTANKLTYWTGPTSESSISNSIVNQPSNHLTLEGDIFQRVVTGQTLPHVIVKANGKLFMVTAVGGAGKVIIFNDPDGVLTNFTVVNLYSNGSGASGFYDSGTGLIYLTNYNQGFARGGISTLNPITNTQASLFDGSALDLDTSPAICTDGTHIYGVTYSGTSVNFFKILMSDGSLVNSTSWPSATFGHGCVMNPNFTEFYCTSYNGRFAKVNCSTMTYTDISTGYTAITDDLIYNSGYVYAGIEASTGYVLKINVSTMAVSATASPLSYGIFTDGTDLYSMGATGYVSKYPTFNLADEYRYSFGGLAVNELVVTDGGRYLFTDYVTGDVYWFGLSNSSLSLGTVTDDSTINSDSIFTNRLNSGSIFTDNFKIGTDHTKMRGSFDINNVSTETFTIADVTTSDSTIYPTYFAGYTSANGNNWIYNVYAYKTVNGTQIFSVNPLQFSFIDDGSFESMYFTFSWNAVAGAEGYRIIVLQDDNYGAYGDYYTDISASFTSAIYYQDGTDGYETNSGTYYNYGSTVTPNSVDVTTGADLYVDSITGHFKNTNSAFAFDGSLTATSLIKSGGTSSQFLKADGSVDSSTYLTSPVGATNGGTGQTTVTTGDLLYGSATNTWSKLADVATGNVLISGGVTAAPSWGKVGLATHVSGTLGVSNGGTNASSFGTTNGLVYYDGTRLVNNANGTFDGSTHSITGVSKVLSDANNYLKTSVINSVPVPAYTNALGTGYRVGLITVTTTFSNNGSATSLLVNGQQDDSFYWNNDATPSGKYIRFDFGSYPKVITEAKYYQSGAFSNANVKWQGSNNASTWTDIGSLFRLGTSAPQTHTSLSTNTTSYRYYQLIATDNTYPMTNSAYIREFEFKLDDGATLVPQLQSTVASANGNTVLNLLGGNVGIGIAVPRYKLDITGSLGVNGNSYFTGDTAFYGSLIVGGRSLSDNSTYSLLTSDSNFAIIRSGSNFATFVFSGSLGGVFQNSLGSFMIDNQAAGAIQFRINGTMVATMDTAWNTGFGTTSPSARLHAVSTTEQLRLGYDLSNYYKTTVSSTGGVTFDAVGSGASFTFSDNVKLTQTVTTETLTSDTSVTIVINGTTYKLLAKA